MAKSISDAGHRYPKTRPFRQGQPPELQPEGPHFDSLQDLLSKAGYKDTRVVTPYAKFVAEPTTDGEIAEGQSSHDEVSKEDIGVHRKGDVLVHRSAPASSLSLSSEASTKRAPSPVSGWFSSLWRTKNPHDVSRQFQQEGTVYDDLVSPSHSQSSRDEQTVMSDHSNDEVLPDNRPQLSGLSTSPIPPTRRNLTLIRASTDVPSPRPSASPNGLWKGSLAYRRSQPNLKRQEPVQDSVSRPRQLKNKGSLGHLRGGVGIGISAIDGGPKLCKNAVGKGPTQWSNIVPQSNQSPTASVSSEQRHPTSGVKSSDDELFDDVPDDHTHSVRLDGSKSDSPVEVSANLFSSAARPIMISEAAVAPRNADCFQGPERRILRQARSVEALRTALAARKKPVKTLKTRHSVIGQQTASDSIHDVPPVPPLPTDLIPTASTSDEDLAKEMRGQTNTTYQAEELKQSHTSSGAIHLATSPERPVGPPVLTLTSPTGVHSPKTLVLSGREYDALVVLPADEGRILIDDGGAQLAQEHSESSSRSEHGTQRGRARRRCSSQRLVRAPSTETTKTGETSESPSDQSEDQVKRTKRGCRAGRKHKFGSRERLRHEYGSDGSDICQKPLSENDAAEPSRGVLKRGTSTRSTERGGKPQEATSMMSFGAAMRGMAAEDDPFMVHVSAQETAKAFAAASKSSSDQVLTHGMAVILASEPDPANAENVPPTPEILSQSRVLRHRDSNSSLRGRIVGRSGPGARSSSWQCDEKLPSRTAASIQSSVVHRMSSPGRTFSGSTTSNDSPTRAMIARRTASNISLR